MVAAPNSPGKHRTDLPLYLHHTSYIATVVGLEKSFQRGKEQAENRDVLVIRLQAVISYDLKEARQPGAQQRDTRTLRCRTWSRGAANQTGVHPWREQPICSKETESELWKAFADQYELLYVRAEPPHPQTTRRVVGRI